MSRSYDYVCDLCGKKWKGSIGDGKYVNYTRVCIVRGNDDFDNPNVRRTFDLCEKCSEKMAEFLGIKVYDIS